MREGRKGLEGKAGIVFEGDGGGQQSAGVGSISDYR